MGAFYKTSDPQNVDFMYQLPENLLMKVVENADTQIDNQLQQAALYGNAVKVPYLEADKDAATAWTNGWNKKIDDLTATINNDPAAWRKNQSTMRDMTRQLQTDLASGDAYRIKSNYDTYASSIKNIDDLSEEYLKDPNANKGISPTMAAAYKASLKNGYKGYKNEDGTFNTLQAINPARYTDISKEGDAWVEKMKADGFEVSTEGTNGRYIIKNKRSGKELTPTEISTNLLDYYMGNDRVMNYLKDGSKYGYTPSLYDKSGKVIRPFDVDDKGHIKFNYESPLAAPIAALAGKYGFRETERSTETKVDQYGINVQQEGIENRKATRDRGWDLEDKKSENVEWREREKLKNAYDWASNEKNRNPDGSVKPMPISMGTENIPDPLVAEQLRVKAVEHNEIKDMQEVAGLKAKLEEAKKVGATTDIININAQIFNKQQDINKSRDLAKEKLRAAGYKDTDIAELEYAKHVFPQKFKEAGLEPHGTGWETGEQKEWRLRAEKTAASIREERLKNWKPTTRDKEGRSQYSIPAADVTLADVEAKIGKRPQMNPAAQALVEQSASYRAKLPQFTRMEGIVQDTKKAYYKERANEASAIGGVVLQGTSGDNLKAQVNTIVAANPDNVELIDPTTGMAAPVKVDASFPKVYSINSVVSYGGAGFKVHNNSTGKDYLMRVRGNNNIDHVVADAFKDHKDVPGVARMLKETQNNLISSMSQELSFVQPGETKEVPINSEQSVRIMRQPNGNYSGYYKDDKGTWLPIPVDGVPLDKGGKGLINATKEFLVDQIAAAAYR